MHAPLAMTVIVLFGGPSDERHVSVASAQNIVRTLDDSSPRPLVPLFAWFWSPTGAVHDVAIPDLLAHERPFEIDFVPTRPAIFPDLEQALDTLPVEDPVFLLALHGTAGEDGTLQRMLEARRIPFTGSGSETSAIAFDKAFAKERVKDHLRVPESRVAQSARELTAVVEAMLEQHERVVLKPLAGGSSRGLFFLKRGDAIPATEDIPYIVEQQLVGRELTVGVVDRGEGPLALPVIEIEVDAGDSFDYTRKYLGGSREICPANIPDTLAREAQAAALTAHHALGCRGYSRSDFIAADEGLYFLELNTLPGLSTRSLVPQQLAAAGISFGSFLASQLTLSGGGG